ncbi:alpha/beta-hydrolase [Earliella scabrosa]|nr:alpha/beta-hydrolase [Earliella scabrosa]
MQFAVIVSAFCVVTQHLHSVSGIIDLVPVALAQSFNAAGSAPNIVDLGYVKYRGNLSFPDTVAYLGVPYAEPPLGERRWRRPLALNTTRVAQDAGKQVIDRTEYPDFCIQGAFGGNGDVGGAGTEDCLNVNVYAPAGAKKGDNLPVLFYIHSGAYVFGNPRVWPFDHWVHQSPNVVIVAVYYRLDSFGFLAVPEFASEDVGDLNVGFWDQIEALRWVQAHIDAFGGDPSRVTINGQSAGGSSVELHMLANQSRGLFSQAIGQSVYRTPLPTLEQQQPMFDYFAHQARCSSGSVADVMACLRRADTSVIAWAQDMVTNNFTGPYNQFRPVIDNVLFNDYPTLSIMRGELVDVPVIVGGASNESLSEGSDTTAALQEFYPALTPEDIEDYLRVYPLSDYGSATQRLNVATGESEFICARHIIGLAAAQRNRNIYTYRYNQPLRDAPMRWVTHGSENWILFRGTFLGLNGTTTFQPQSDLDRAFAEEMIAYWLSFVRSGDPNTFKVERSPVWPAYSPRDMRRIVLQESRGEDASIHISGSRVEEEPASESARCEFVVAKAVRQQA